MANHPSAEKRNRQRIKRTDRNRALTSSVRTLVKRVRTALHAKDKEAAGAALKAATKDKNGVVSIDQLALDVRGLSHPMVTDGDTFDSFFKMKEKKKLDLGFLDGKGGA